MIDKIDAVIVFLILSNLILLGMSRLGACIRIVAIQGIALGFLPILVHSGELTGRIMFLAAGTIILKGLVFPRLLWRAAREADVRREVEPYVGYTLSMVIGTVVFLISEWIGSRLPLPNPMASSLMVPVALFSILVGLFIIISRRKAINQVLGYLVFENGVYAFGISLTHEVPVLVELGMLLDIFVGVFVMGIAIFHINREFDHIDTDRLSTLKD